MNGMILTASGRNLLAKALTGKTLHFTRAFVGDGTLGSRTPSSLTALISPKRELPIHSMNTTGSLGTCEVVLEMSNKGLTQGFFVREYGLFALDPDNSQEILYSYCNKGDEAGYLEGDNGVDIISYTLSIVTVIDQAQNVTATITNSNQYVTASRLEQRITDIFAPYQPAKGFWTYSNGDTERIRPATLEQAKELILEGVNVKAFNSRIERLEDAINQTLLALEILQAYPGCSHYLAEDFKDTSQIDTFSGQVLSVVAGDDSLDVEPLDGMLPGSWYTLSDGISAELVQVHSINLENNIQRVILADTVKNTYILRNTKLYRTNCTLDNMGAVGVSDTFRASWNPDTVWKGIASSETVSVSLDTSAGNSKNFTFTGSAVFDSSGQVSLSA